MTAQQEKITPFWCHILSDQAGENSPGDAWASWLAKEIGNYPIPAKLSGRVNLRGEIIPVGRLTVCVTRSAADNNPLITAEIAEKLGRSLNLVVLCSPWATRSPLVDQVVRSYKMSGRSARLLAAIIAGIPHAAETQSAEECFPAATRFNVNALGELLKTPAEPIAADFRTADGGEGWIDPSAYLDALIEADFDEDEAEALAEAYAKRLQLMKLKIIAGILGVSLGELTERDVVQQRLLRAQNRNQALLRFTIFGLLGGVGIWAGVLAWRSHEETMAAKQLASENRQATAAEAQAIELAKAAAEQTRPRRLTDEASKLLEAKSFTGWRAQAFAKLKEAAELGFGPAQYDLAKLYFEDKNEASGSVWLLKACAQAYPPAINFLGECHRERKRGFQGGRAEAGRQFLAAANMGYAPAQSNLARLAEENEQGLGGMPEALKWYLKAADKLDGYALYRLYRIFALGDRGIKPDAVKASTYLRQAAEAGNLDAQWELGTKLTQGNGMPKDIAAGVSLLRKVAAQADNPSLAEMAQIHIAILYRDGQMRIASTADGDLAEAMRMLKAVAERGNNDACFHLAITYADSRRSVADEASSLFWHRKAAELGNSESRMFMARKLLNDLKENLVLHNATRWLNAREGISSDGTDYPNLFRDPVLGFATAAKDYRDATTWLKEARPNSRNPAAVYKVFLAELYLTEDFHPDDKFAEAFTLLNEAKDMKDALAEAMLSNIYAKGHPPQIQPDPAKAADLRTSSLATGKPGPRVYFERLDRIANARRTFTTEYINALQQAATRGDIKAQTELGLHFLHLEPYQETLLPLDLNKAAQQLAPGALHSDTLALMGLGLTYRETKDLPNRFKLHLKAAQNGDEPRAQLWTGVALEQGIGTSVDLVEAYKWYLIAFKNGLEGSSAAKKRAESKMTADQQVESRRRADDYKPIKASRTEIVVAQDANNASRAPTTTTEKKADKPIAISPAIMSRSVRALVDDAERILSVNQADPLELEKALLYAQAAVAKSRSHTQAMDAAARAAARKGDLEVAQKWLLTIANQKLSNSTNPNLNRIAMANLASNFDNGIGTPVDKVEAYKWRVLELKAMGLSSHQQLDRLESVMTPAEVAEARKRAKAFRPSGY